MKNNVWVRVLPFAVFLIFIGLQQSIVGLTEKGILAATDKQLLYLYPVKALVVAGLLLAFWRQYHELRLRDLADLKRTAGSILLGLLVFVLWINMDWNCATVGECKGYDPTLTTGWVSPLLIGFRLFGAVLVVPLMEELFWRSFLLRYLINSDFEGVAIGTFTWGSFIISAVLFGLEHNLLLAGIMAGVAYNLLLYRTKSVAQCVLAHAVTNLALGIYVLQTGHWYFW